MKRGDKVYCILDFDETHIKDKSYIIDEIKKNKIFLTTEKAYKYGFSINEIYHNWEFFNDYFITEKELRKLKLNKINDNL